MDDGEGLVDDGEDERMVDDEEGMRVDDEEGEEVEDDGEVTLEGGCYGMWEGRQSEELDALLA